MWRRCLYRPLAKSSVSLPFSARSVGHYKVPQIYVEKALVKNFVQLFWGIEGEGAFTIKGKEYILKPKQVVFFLCGEEHLLHAVSEVWNYRWATIDGPMNMDIFSAFNFQRKPSYAGVCPEELFIKLEQEIFDISPAGQRDASATAYSIFAAAAGRRPQKNPSDFVVERCVRLIKERYGDSLTNINLLADELNIHRTSLSKIFKNKMGVSTVDYLVSMRIQKALSMLKETNFSIAEIAERSGYSDANYFSKAVKKAIGLSPAQFRKQ